MTESLRNAAERAYAARVAERQERLAHERKQREKDLLRKREGAILRFRKALSEAGVPAEPDTYVSFGRDGGGWQCQALVCGETFFLRHNGYLQMVAPCIRHDRAGSITVCNVVDIGEWMAGALLATCVECHDDPFADE